MIKFYLITNNKFLNKQTIQTSLKIQTDKTLDRNKSYCTSGTPSVEVTVPFPRGLSTVVSTLPVLVGGLNVEESFDSSTGLVTLVCCEYTCRME